MSAVWHNQRAVDDRVLHTSTSASVDASTQSSRRGDGAVLAEIAPTEARSGAACRDRPLIDALNERQHFGHPALAWHAVLRRRADA